MTVICRTRVAARGRPRSHPCVASGSITPVVVHTSQHCSSTVEGEVGRGRGEGGRVIVDSSSGVGSMRRWSRRCSGPARPHTSPSRCHAPMHEVPGGLLEVQHWLCRSCKQRYHRPSVYSNVSLLVMHSSYVEVTRNAKQSNQSLLIFFRKRFIQSTFL